MQEGVAASCCAVCLAIGTAHRLPVLSHGAVQCSAVGGSAAAMMRMAVEGWLSHAGLLCRSDDANMICRMGNQGLAAGEQSADVELSALVYTRGTPLSLCTGRRTSNPIWVQCGPAHSANTCCRSAKVVSKLSTSTAVFLMPSAMVPKGFLHRVPRGQGRGAAQQLDASMQLG